MNKNIKAGEIIQIGDSEFIGNMPIRTEIEVLPADEANGNTVGWKCYEVRGAEIWFADDSSRTPITRKEDLKIGDQVIVPTLVGNATMTISELNDDKGTAESDHSIGMLEFGADGRNVWTSSMSINKKVFNIFNK